MAIVENVITPIVQFVIYLFLIGWIFYLFYWVYKHFLKKYKYVIKYKIFKRKYDPKMVAWCIRQSEKGYKVVDIKKYLLIKGHKLKEVDEIAYIFNQVTKKLKGGEKKKKNGR